MRRTVTVAMVAVLLLGSGCSSSSSDTTSTTVDQSRRDQPGATVPAVPAPASGACDPIDPSACLLPWPNDRFTRADPARPTGRRVDLPAKGMPANAGGTRIDPGEWNRNDGFAPASNLITHVDGLDAEASKLPPVTDIGRSLDPTSPLVIVDHITGRRVAAWAELDANAKDPRKQALLITPAATLAEGHTFSVGLRNLKRGDGADIAPSEAFSDELAQPDATAEATFAALEGSGVKRRDLDLAWSFTVGSAESISGRLRHMWSETAAALGKGAPPFTVTSNETDGGVRTVAGTFDMPRYLEGTGGPGSFLNNDEDPDGTPQRNGTMADDFLCTVPAGATAAKPSEAVVYGHGLLGSRTEVLGIGKIAASAGLTFCALDYLGMSSSDISSVVASFDDLTAFRALPDRLQQGHLGFLLLGRLLRSTEGFAKDPAFQDDAGRPIIDTGDVSLLGASQGGILGGVASSLTNDWSQVVLAVGGLGYNVLLRRSVDFDRFAPLLAANYPDPLEQPLILDLLEQLWQRGENAGYAQHLTRSPYPGVAAKNVLLLEAFGDHQVANVATERLARTLRIDRRAPTLADGRSPATDPYFGIAPIAKLPAKGSGLVVWDFDTPAPPVANQANRAGDDPHGKLGDEPGALAIVLSFVRDQRLIDVCDAKPCHTPD